MNKIISILSCGILLITFISSNCEDVFEYRIWSSLFSPSDYVDGKLCNRKCDGKNLNCFFNFTLENFLTMSKACYDCPNTLSDCWRPDCIPAGGIKRTVSVINRQLPGPTIEVCEGDKVMVFLQNKLFDGISTSIHWHGQHMVRSKYMDGTAWVTQCPILSNNNFTYEFYADNVGTYWWHSHFAMQLGDLFGALIVREQSSKNPHAKLYDFDLSSHVMQVGDWNNQSRLDVFEKYALGGLFLEPTGILVNGLGYQSSSNIGSIASANFTVKCGKRYRFRFINVGFSDCPLEVSIDGHKMLIIAADGHYVKPFEVDSFVSTTGERYDFVLNATQAISTYYIRVKGYLTCGYSNVYTVATLIYEGSTTFLSVKSLPTYDNAAPTGGVIFNPISVKNATGYSKVIGIDEIEAVEPIDSGIKSKNVKRHYITIGMNSVNNTAYSNVPYYGYKQVPDPTLQPFVPQFNHLSNRYMESPYLPARFDLNSKKFCDEKTMRDKDCEHNFCECPHVLEIAKDAIVEIVFIDVFHQDLVPAIHPIHLHGYSFRVLGWGEIGRNITKKQVIQMDKEGKLKRNFVNPPLKDTVTVPKGGYTIIRFKADNLGYWLLHCHIGYHTIEGMDIVLKVGKNSEMPRVPKNFPKCKNYKK